MPEQTSAASLAATPAHLAQHYRPIPGAYDEMCAADGNLRPHWEYLIGALNALGVEEIGHRWQDARRLLRENGVTYNVYEDPQATERLWPLDPIPMLLTSSEWSVIEQGLIQRAELLDLVLADLYGPRKLFRKGLLPPELIYAHPGFLRPCDGVSSARRRHLQLYAADLARGPDGVFRVIGDRTQAPSGSGYALENRTVLARIFPSLYRDSHVHRLALYFRGLRSTLAALDPRQGDNPRVGLLTPGPENEAYFEHAYLASYLGLTLVQGGDLTMRDDRVWLRTLDGLKPVDVILRRVDDTYCDPLELRADSLLGAPGLLQAARIGQVAIANTLGSGILENPGLLAFLPALCRELLGEEPKLPSPRTWWCGSAADLNFVLEHLDTLVIKPLAPHRSSSTIFGDRLTSQARQELTERIRAHPSLFAAQEQVALSTAPVAYDGRLEPRPMVLRTFLVAGDEGYLVMPGGLSRVSPSTDTRVVSNQQGGVSKDVWVLASEPERQISLLASTSQLVTVTRAGDDVPGRVADNLFWLGRYAERTEGSVRLLRETLPRLMDAARGQQDDCLPLLLRALTHLTATHPGFVGPDSEKLLRDPDRELLSVVFDRTRTGSVRYNIDALVRAGRSVRDRLSSDTSRVINTLNRELIRPSDVGTAVEAVQRLIILLAAFAGLCEESMSRGPGWRFLEIGRCLERALGMLSLLRNIFVPAAGAGSAYEALLAVAHSVKTYRRRYRSQLQPGAVLDLLLLDETNPRSVVYQLALLESLVAALEEGEAPRRTVAGRITLNALTQLRLFDVAAALVTAQTDADTEADAHQQVDDFLLQLTQLLAELSDELTRRYFSHIEQSQQLVRLV